MEPLARPPLAAVTLALTSDLHMDHYKVQQRTPPPPTILHQAEAKDAPSILVVAGDLSTGGTKEMAIDYLTEVADKWSEVVVVLGNHDFYDSTHQDCCKWWREQAPLPPNVHVLQRDAITLHGVRFAGASLWTGTAGSKERERWMRLNCMKMNDFTCIYGWGMDDMLREHLLDLAWLRKQAAEVDVLVTHHLPFDLCITPKWQKSSLNSFFSASLDPHKWAGPQLWLHGHTHSEVELVTATGMRVCCYPRGYPGERLR
jgi:predicted MPP superfamily phosphohydrolase